VSPQPFENELAGGRRQRRVTGVRVIDDTEFSDDSKASHPAATAGWIWVRSDPSGALILVDGTATALRTPARLELQEGDHVIRLEREGFGATERKMSVSRGQTVQITETLSAQ
jgi:hypothetical protein